MAYQTGTGSGVRGCSLEISETLLDSKTRKICKIVTSDEKGTVLLTRTLHNGRFEELMVRVGQQAKCALTLGDLERFLNGERLYTKGDTFW